MKATSKRRHILLFCAHLCGADVLSMPSFNSFESNEADSDYAIKMRKDCRNTGIYCVASIGLLIAAGAITSPVVANALPGGPATVLFLGILIIISVFLLCYWQRPRSISKSSE
jgi:hypothetical protein